MGGNLRWTLAGLAALGLCYLATASAAWSVGLSQKDLRLPAIIPDDPDISMASALARFRQTERLPLPPSELAALQDAARLAPLADEPFLFAAMARLAKGKSSLRLLEEGRRRNPRSREIRLLLLQQYLTENRTAPAVEEAGALSQLVPQGSSWLVTMLSSIAQAPRLGEDTVAALRASPLRISILRELAENGAPSQRIFQIAADMHASPKQEENRPWADITQHVAIQGDIAGARKLWSHFYGVETDDAAPFDGELAGIAGPPFGWRITSGSAGIAEMSNGSLRVQYFGRKRTEFARQLITLPPGDFRLKFVTSPRPDEQQANLLWKVSCVNGGTILQLPLRKSTSPFDMTPSDTFSVPESECALQWLTLEGNPSLDAETRTAEIQSVTIDHV